VPRKAAFVTENFDERRKNCNAYIVFSADEEAEAAVKALSGAVFEGNHLNTDMANNDSMPDHRRSVFVGNLPFDIEEEELYEAFGHCGDVSNVRVIRDRGTNIGKGIAYVAFKDRTAVSIAVGLHGQELRRRQMRVSRCQKPNADKPAFAERNSESSDGKGGKGKGGKGSKGGKGKGKGKGSEGKGSGGKGGEKGGRGEKKPRHMPRTGATSGSADAGAAWAGAQSSGEVDKSLLKKANKSLALKGIEKKKAKKPRDEAKRNARKEARFGKGRKV